VYPPHLQCYEESSADRWNDVTFVDHFQNTTKSSGDYQEHKKLVDLRVNGLYTALRSTFQVNFKLKGPKMLF